MTLAGLGMVSLWGSAVALCAQDVSFIGTIGPYEIEAQLSRATLADAQVTGRYRYAGRSVWLTLKGEVFDRDAMEIRESAEGVETGRFFLNVEADMLTGFWAAGEVHHPAELRAEAGEIADLLPARPEVPVNPGVTGRYSVGRHWVNALFAPHYEIGFNGGAANVVEIDADRILVDFDFIVGPTYHLASFKGVARRIEAGVYAHNAVLPGGSAPCHLTFRFTAGGLSVSDHAQPFACQFGARAHANFDLTKVSDRAEFEDTW